MHNKILRVLTAVTAVLILTSCGTPIIYDLSKSNLTEKAVIREIIIESGRNGQTDSLFTELRKLDPAECDLWEEILSYRDRISSETSQASGQLPDCLPQDDSLCILVPCEEACGEELSDDELEERFETALVCVKQYPNAFVLFAGGGSAGKMADRLIANGIDSKRILTAYGNESSVQNAYEAYDVLKSQDSEISSAAIISSPEDAAEDQLFFEAVFSKAAMDHKPRELDVVSDCAFHVENADYETNVDEIVTKFLNELSDFENSRQKRLKDKLAEYWDHENSEMIINEGSLPDDLPNDDSLCLAVLGYALNDDGTMTDELINRLKTTLTCAEQYPNSYILCSGGGTAADNESVTEAGLMAEWLISHGIDSDRLITEDESLSTQQNAEFSCKLLLNDHPSVSSVVIITSSYHIRWSCFCFKRAFLDAVSEPEIHVVSVCTGANRNIDFEALPSLQTACLLHIIGEDGMAKTYLDS